MLFYHTKMICALRVSLRSSQDFNVVRIELHVRQKFEKTIIRYSMLLSLRTYIVILFMTIFPFINSKVSNANAILYIYLKCTIGYKPTQLQLYQIYSWGQRWDQLHLMCINPSLTASGISYFLKDKTFNHSRL